MSHQAYEAFNRLARRFHEAVGSEGPATDAEAAQLAAEYINAVMAHLSDENLSAVLDEFRAGKARMESSMMSVQKWLEEESDRRKKREFEQFVTELHSKMGHVV
jgi:hypothetical protein